MEGGSCTAAQVQVLSKRCVRGGGADGNGDVEGPHSPSQSLAALHSSPTAHPAHQGVSFEKSEAPNGWTDGDFIILAFLPKTVSVLLQRTMGLPRGFIISKPSGRTGSSA